jgi:uncharacterized membrane protein YhaH (DUF805 family)
VYGHPETWNGFWEIILGQQFQGDVGGPLADVPGKIARLLDFAVLQLGPLFALVPAGLLVTAIRHPRYALFSATATLLTCLFAGFYHNAAIERYYLGPAFFAWTWLAVLAAVAAERLAGTAGHVDAAGPGDDPHGDARAVEAPDRPSAVTAGLVAAAVGLALLVPTALLFNARWQAADRSQETWAAAWIDDLFTAVEPDGVVISWWSYSTPAWYGQLIEGRRPDVWIVDDRTRLDENLGEVEDVIDRFLGKRPVYVIRAQESSVIVLAQRYAIEPVGRPDNLYRVTGRLESQP